MEHNRAVQSQLDLTDLSTAIRSEYVRIFTERRDDLIAVGFNALLVTICWFLLPDKIVNWLFTLHGPLAFPYFLEMWMLGDTPATNVAGRDAVRAAQQLRDPAALRLWLRAKHIVLWSFVGPIGAIVAIVIGLVQHTYANAAAAAIVLLLLPLGVLSVAAWVGIWMPYHPQRLLWRWRHRSDWRAALVRWLALVLVPFLDRSGNLGRAADTWLDHLDHRPSGLPTPSDGFSWSLARYGRFGCGERDDLCLGAWRSRQDSPPALRAVA